VSFKIKVVRREELVTFNKEGLEFTIDPPNRNHIFT